MVKPVSISAGKVAIPATTTPIPKPATTAEGVPPSLIADIAHTVLHLLSVQVSPATKAAATANLTREFAVIASMKLTEQAIYSMLYGELFGADANAAVATMVASMDHVGEKTYATADELAVKLRQTFSLIAFCLATGGDIAALIAAL